MSKQELKDLYNSLDQEQQRQARELLLDVAKKSRKKSTTRIIAYFTTSNDAGVESEQIRRFIREQLPDYMLPSFFIPLADFPRTPNGKVDHNQLPAPVISKDAEENNKQPVNEKEEILLSIWKEVLYIDNIGTNSNFFDIGGDSILSIQIIAKAKQRGVHITPKQMFQEMTISRLASVASEESTTIAEQTEITGTIPLTPIQHWLYDQNQKNPAYWNQGYFFDVPPDFDVEIFKQALQSVISHHDILKARFDFKQNPWTQEIVAGNNQPECRIIDIRNEEDNIEETIQKSVIEVHATIKPESGMNIASALFVTGEAFNRLFITVHHLVVDTVSWRIIQEDLETEYNRLSGRPGSLPPKTTSYKLWSEKLNEIKDSEAILKDAGYWLQIENFNNNFPVDLGDVDDASEATSMIHRINLDENYTNKLLRDVPAVYNTQIDDILLAALLQTYHNLTSHSSLMIEMEGHGREQLDSRIDITRTVGWFTSFYNVGLRSENIQDIDATIKSVKESLRLVPDKGIAFGILRYLSQSTDPVVERIKKLPAPAILYNNLGQYKSTEKDEVFKLTGRNTEPNHDPQNGRHHILEINVMITESILHLDFNYSTALHSQQTIANFAESYKTYLTSIIDFCVSTSKGGFTPSDFPEADLDQDDLDSLLDELDGLDK